MKLPAYINIRNFFKLYFVFLLFYILPGLVTPNVSLKPIEYVGYAMWITAALGVFGYAFGKIIFVPKFWKFFLLFFAMWSVFDFIWGSDLDYGSFSYLELFILVSATFLLILLPTYIALYLYSYKDINPAINNRIKLLLLGVFVLFATNAITAKVTQHRNYMKLMTIYTSMDALKLYVYDENRSDTLKSLLVTEVESLFLQAGRTDDIEEFLPVCKTFDNKKMVPSKKVWVIQNKLQLQCKII